jgi:hypothetical protein
MKNQYFGDVNDYRKYGLLRLLNRHGQIATTVCWLLTPDDGRTDGNRLQYLYQPPRWSGFDPDLYGFLRELVVERDTRHVGALERANILPGCRFWSEAVPDDSRLREQYFQKVLEFARGTRLAFFDPDNGMEVKSVPFGRGQSSKYLFWREVVASFSAGHSLLIYQHFPHARPEPFVHDLAQKFGAETGVSRVYSYRTPHVAFFLVPQPEDEALFVQSSAEVARLWEGQIEVDKHDVAAD